jgi:hypothetical protein
MKSLKIVGLSVEIRTKHILNTIWKHYQLTILLRGFLIINAHVDYLIHKLGGDKLWCLVQVQANNYVTN